MSHNLDFQPFDWTSDHPVVYDVELHDRLILPYTDAMLERLYDRLDNPPPIPAEPPILLNGEHLSTEEWEQTIQLWNRCDDKWHNAIFHDVGKQE